MPPAALTDRPCPYALPAWVKTSIDADGGGKASPPLPAADPARTQSFTLRALASADGSGCAWGAEETAAPAASSSSPSVQAVRCVADAPVEARALAADLVALGAAVIPSSAAIPAAARAAIAARGLDSTFFVYDLGALHRCFAGWAASLPGVTPHFAVKANPDKGLLRCLAALGAGFDCASRAEISLVLGLGVSPDRIVYAHPCKPPAEVRFACAAGVALTTFDTVGEVDKLAAWHPRAKALLRIRADDPTARFCLGSKYGCEVGDAPALLAAAKRAGLAVAGVAFHVGSGARDPAAYGRAVAAAAAVFVAGRAAGHESMTLLDCGGGFAGGDPAAPDAGLGAAAASLRAALAEHFPPGCGVRVIAEPGRFFAEPVGTLAVAVNGVRARAMAAVAAAAPTSSTTTTSATPAAPDAVDYWLSDGVYGCLNSIIYDDARLAFLSLRLGGQGEAEEAEEAEDADGADTVEPRLEGGGGGGGAAVAPVPAPPALLPSTLYGPTCDSADIVARGVPLPRLAVGDFLLCPRASAYSIAGASNFNGFQAAKAGAVYVYSLEG